MELRNDCWVHPHLAVRASSIEGRGLFALLPLAAETVVVELGGRLVTTNELTALVASATTYVDTITVGSDVHLVLPDGTKAHFANHSCAPNLLVRERTLFATNRPVAADEELTIDYGTISGASGPMISCQCGAATCRKMVEA